MTFNDPFLLLITALATLPWAGFLLRQACSVWKAELPSYLRAFLSVVFVGFLGYFLFDIAGYGLMRATAGSGIKLSAGYTYLDWISEAPLTKWYAMNMVPGLRGLLILFVLSVAIGLQTLILDTGASLQQNALIFLSSWAVNGVIFFASGWLLSLVLSSAEKSDPQMAQQRAAKPKLVIREDILAQQQNPEGAAPGPGKLAAPAQPKPPPVEEQLEEIRVKLEQLGARIETAENNSDPDIQEEVETLRQRINGLDPQRGSLTPPPLGKGYAPTAAYIKDLSEALAAITAVYREEAKKNPAGDGEISQIGRKGEDLEADTLEDEGAGLNRYLVSVQRSAEPFTRLLPAPVRKFLKQGGWWGILGFMALLSCLWLSSFVRRLQFVLRQAARRPAR